MRTRKIAAAMWGEKIQMQEIFLSVLERLQCGCVHVMKTTHDLIPSQKHSRKQRNPVGCVFNTPLSSYLELYAEQTKNENCERLFGTNKVLNIHFLGPCASTRN